MTVSIIIGTRNRASSLEKTLRAFDRVFVPQGWNPELLVVDNSSTDGTEMVVKSASLSNYKVRYLREAKPGKSNALNSGLRNAQGEILLFTDDDVVPATDWLERMASPLINGECDAVQGRVEVAPDLLRPWMEPMHQVWLATPSASFGAPLEFVGANMGFRRAVLDRVPAFDPELGPGASGFGEESLFSWQLCEAGFRLISVPEAVVVHHPDSLRLLRPHWLSAARSRGRGSAYFFYHWEHGDPNRALFRMLWVATKLYLRRCLQRPAVTRHEGCPAWEMSYVFDIERCRQLLKERKRPRNYAKRGLVKLDARPARA
jgi:glycosyltransferase involved in cell wall biosynthesis